MFPWNLFLKEGGKKRLSDIEYLAIKDFDGKRVDNDGEVTLAATTTETTIVTVTANSGKDMYLGGAEASWLQSAGATNNSITFRLFLNAVELEKKVFERENLGDDGSYLFLTKGAKVAATQIIKITAQNGDAGPTTIHNGKLILFEETTGETPAV